MLPQYLATTAATIGLQVANLHELLRTEPRPGVKSSGDTVAELTGLAQQRVRDIGHHQGENEIKITGSIPTDDLEQNFKTASNNHFAGHGRMAVKDTGKHIGSQVWINPNLSEEYLAHELGHHVTDQTKPGRMISSLRRNPKLARALGAAGLALPMIQASLQAGDDDVGAGIAIAYLAGAPTIIDEALATKNGLALLEQAGRRATSGQRLRLAGGGLSYAAKPLLSGMFGTVVGNVADDYTAVYNLGEDNQGELPM